MSNPTHPGLSEQHHHPPSTAEWVTSPLTQQHELLHNPLEAPPHTVKPLLHLGVALVIGGGLLSAAGNLLQFAQMDHVAIWYLWLVMLTAILATGAVAGSLMLLHRVTSGGTKQVIFFAFAATAVLIVDIVVTLTVADSRARLGGGVWVSVGSVLLLLVGGGILRFVGRPEGSEQDQVDQTKRDRQVRDYTRGGRFIGGWRRNWDPPLPGD